MLTGLVDQDRKHAAMNAVLIESESKNQGRLGGRQCDAAFLPQSDSNINE